MEKEKLAILGGKPILDKPLPKTNNIQNEEIGAALRVLNSGTLSDFLGRAGDLFLGGKEVRDFESAIQKKFKMEYAVSFNSATTALESAVASLMLEPGSEIIVPPYTMTATVMAVVVNNLTPVFADISPSTFCLDIASIEEKITPNTKAVMAVNLFGGSLDYARLLDLARKHNLYIIEDNAQSAGGTYKGKYLGTIGDIGVFSFNVHKTIQSGEGGVLVTNNKDLALRAQLKRNHGENAVDDLKLHDIPIAGSNYRMSELHAAIASEQLKKLDFLNNHRIELADYLYEKLQGIEGINTLPKQDETKHVYYIFPILFDENKFGTSRDKFIDAMKAEGFSIFGGYVKPIYLINFFQDNSTKKYWQYIDKNMYKKGICPEVEKMYEKKLVTTFVCRYPLEKSHIDLFVKAIKKIKENVNFIQ